MTDADTKVLRALRPVTTADAAAGEVNPKRANRTQDEKSQDPAENQPDPGTAGATKPGPAKPPTTPSTPAGRFTNRRGNQLSKFKNLRAVEVMTGQRLPASFMAEKLAVSVRTIRKYVAELKAQLAADLEDPSQFLAGIMTRLKADASKARDKEMLGLAMKGELALVATFRQLSDLKAQAAEAKAEQERRAQLSGSAVGADRQLAFERMSPEQLGEELLAQEAAVLAMAHGEPGVFGVGFASECRSFAARWAALAERHDLGDPVPRLPEAVAAAAEVEAEAVPEPVPPPFADPAPEPAPSPKAPGRVHSAPSRGYPESAPRLVAEERTTVERRVYIDATDGDYDSPGQRRAYERARGA